MADVLKEEDDNDDFVVVETPPQEDTKKDQPQEDEADDKDDHDDDDDHGDDDGDERLAESQDDSDEEITSSRKRRLKRREIRKRAKENAERELRFLREQNADLLRRVQTIEGNTLQQNEASIDAKIQETMGDIAKAEAILAEAIKQSNGADAAAAIRLRDEARNEVLRLQAAKQQFQTIKAQASQPDPRVTNYAKEWISANPWYDPNGSDEDSRITKAIDDGLAREGYNPSTLEYWQELTRRVAARLGDDGPSAVESRPRRKAPPTGVAREHAPVSTKKEIYVSPERKQAMIEAGVWDDPVARNRMLKAYAAYDKNSSAR